MKTGKAAKTLNVLAVKEWPYWEPFDGVAIEVDYGLSPSEIEQVGQCLRYAVIEVLGSKVNVGWPSVDYSADQTLTRLYYPVDSKNNQRTQQNHYAEALLLIQEYVTHGTPKRVTNAVGPKGSRAHDGIDSFEGYDQNKEDSIRVYGVS